MPFEHFARCSRIVHESVYDTGNAAWKGCAGVGNTVAHRVAGAYLYRDARFLAELVQLGRKRNDKAVKIGAGDVLKVAAGVDAAVENVLDYAEVLIERLCAGKSHLLVYMVV